MTEKDNFTLDNPIMYDKKNGRCRCIPIPYEKDMTEKRFTVKQLIKYLADFNPNAVIMNNINPSWFTGMGEEEIRNIENEKLNASKVWLFDDDEEAKK